MDELKNKLIDDCNNSNLPLEAVYYIVKDLYRDVCDTYNEYLERVEKQKLLKALEDTAQDSEVKVEEVSEE